jgi:putative Mn2+ efflux pump MntP
MTVHLLSLLLLAFAVSLDGFGVGVTYGLRHIRIPVISVLIIAVFSGFVIWLSMQAGTVLTGFLSPAAAQLLGALILIGIGTWALAQFWRSRKREQERGHETGQDGDDRNDFDYRSEGQLLGSNPSLASVSTIWRIELRRLGLVIHILRAPQAADVDRSGIISASEAVLLGCALSLDAFGAGLGAAMIGYSPLMTAILIAFASGLFLLSGLRIGLKYADWQGMKALSVLPGLILILMGITRLL